MSSVNPGIYISKLVLFALNTIEKVDILHRETLYPCFVILITASQVDFTAGFQIYSNINWHHDNVITSAVFRSSGLSWGDNSCD